MARALWLVLAVLPAAPGCRARASTTAPHHAAEGGGAWPEPPAEGFVVLPWGTRVTLEPRVGGVAARLGAPWQPPPPWPATGYVARVVGQREGFVEIAPILPAAAAHSLMVEPTQPHCGPVLDGETFDVRLYVSPWALAPVLTRPVDVALDDGSALALRPGAVARPIPGDPQGRSAVSAAGILVRAVLPPDAMALAYAAPLPMSMPSHRGWELPQGRPFSYDGWPLVVELGFGQDVAIASVVPRDDGHWVELTSPCARVVAHSTQAPVAWAQPEFGHFTEFGLGGPHEVPAGVLAHAGLEPIEIEIEPAPEGEVSAIGELVPMVESGTMGQAIGGFGIIGPPAGAPARPEHVFEEGAPVYLSTAGAPAGTLARMRVFVEDGWLAGDRMCFHTSFGSRFDPVLPVCLPVAEARLRNPATDVFDFSAGVVRPGSLHITGALAEPTLARALRRHRTDLRRCVGETMMRGHPPPTGELELGLHVSGKGVVTQVELRSPPVEWLGACAVMAARQWVLPATQDGKPAQVVLTVRLEVQ